MPLFFLPLKCQLTEKNSVNMVRLRSKYSTTTPIRTGKRRSLSESATSTSSTSSNPFGATPPEEDNDKIEAVTNNGMLRSYQKCLDAIKNAKKLSKCPVCLSAPICDNVLSCQWEVQAPQVWSMNTSFVTNTMSGVNKCL